MRRLISYALIGLALVGVGPAFGEELLGSTSCADYLRMQDQDTRPGADHAIAVHHVTSLMHLYSKYILRDSNGKPLPTIVNFIISYSTHWCQRYPTATVAEAGEAIGIVEQRAITESRKK